ncbi:putative terpene synthase family protein [Diaporthe ampelina]|uniref:Putative terpene synthase family protein n=1 Tax=Diaporthe ampelina TaxID=1214573 RepID=A0A0G2I0Z4_9PEZI|nr:putative terpene synthase family protein [Diaporthe ampelina]
MGTSRVFSHFSGDFPLANLNCKNTSEYYPIMLLAKAFVMFLTRWESRDLDRSHVSEDLLREKIPVILLDILLKILNSQEDDGSWNHQQEPTAYATLALAALRRLPWVEPLAPEIQSRVSRGSDYLLGSKDRWMQGAHIWIEKIAYSSSNLSLTYCLAATKSAGSVESVPYLGQEVSSLLFSSPKMIRSFHKFFSALPAFAKEPYWRLELWILQAFQFSSRLGRSGLDILTRKNTGEGKYLAYIPFTWISISNGSRRISLSSQWGMMVCSLLNFQIDEFIEFSVAQEYNKSIGHLKTVARRLCTPQILSVAVSSMQKSDSKKSLNGNHNGEQIGNGDQNSPDSKGDEATHEAEDKLSQFVNHFLRHPSVVQSPTWMQSWLAQQLQRCLQAHLTHLEDCQEFAGPSPQGNDQATKPWTYFDWVHSTPADSTTAKFSFVFYLCLALGEGGDKLLGDSDKKGASYFPRYVAEDMCAHLSAMCRQQNDYGSLARDRAEGNLNSADFSDLYLGVIDAEADKDARAAKKMLLDVAAYEHACLENAMAELGRYLDQGVMDAIRVLIEVTDLYGQIYIVRDLNVKV